MRGQSHFFLYMYLSKWKFEGYPLLLLKFPALLVFPLNLHFAHNKKTHFSPFLFLLTFASFQLHVTYYLVNILPLSLTTTTTTTTKIYLQIQMIYGACPANSHKAGRGRTR